MLLPFLDILPLNNPRLAHLAHTPRSGRRRNSGLSRAVKVSAGPRYLYRVYLVSVGRWDRHERGWET